MRRVQVIRRPLASRCFQPPGRLSAATSRAAHVRNADTAAPRRSALPGVLGSLVLAGPRRLLPPQQFDESTEVGSATSRLERHDGTPCTGRPLAVAEATTRGRRIRAPAFDSANVVSPEWTRASSTCPSCHHPGMASASESTEAPPFVRAVGAACTRSRIPRRLPSRRDRGRDREAPAPLRGLAAEVDTKPCPFVVILWFTEANLHITPARCPSVPKHGRHAPRRSSRGPRRDESSRGRPQAATAPERSIPGR